MADTGGRPDDSAASPDDINDRLDEIAAELAAEARFKEPSAAERARVPVGQKPARPGSRGPLRGWRSRRTAAWLREPVQSTSAGARAAPAGRSRGQPGPVPGRGYAAPTRPHPGRSLLTLVVMLVLMGGVSFGLRALLHGARAPGSAPPSPRATASGTSPAPAPPSAAPPSAGTLAALIAGTPAQNFANGAAGIALPTARSYGPFTAAQVAADYRTMRELLITSRLDLATVLGDNTTNFAGLLATSERTWFIKNLSDKGLTRQGDLRSSRAWLVSFAPGSTELIGTVIKVHGRMTAQASSLAHTPALRIHADYLFVYPVEVPGQPDTAMLIVDRDYLTVYFGPWNEPASSATVPWIEQDLGSPAGAQCADFDGYVRPAFAGSTPSVQSSGSPIDPWNQSTPPPSGGGCHLSAGT
jgi:hypothetical protein